VRALTLALLLGLLATPRGAAGCTESSHCDDGRYCNGRERCEEGLCVSGPPPIVDDGVDCTEDRCEEAHDRVVHEPKDERCSDGLYCNGVERCQSLLGCRPGNPAPIDDGIDCTIDRCDEATFSVIHEPQDLLCQDGNECTLDHCDAALGCTVEHQDGICDDRRDCTTDDRCVDGVCLGTPSTCGDGVLREDCSEECDDGNDWNWDGCSTVCRIEGLPRLAGTLPYLQATLERLAGAGFPEEVRAPLEEARSRVAKARWWIERREPVMYPLVPALAELSRALDALQVLDVAGLGLTPLVDQMLALPREISLYRLDAVDCLDSSCEDQLDQAQRIARRAKKRERRDLYKAADLYKDAWDHVWDQP
jgi:cysteine-rich repeat protein